MMKTMLLCSVSALALCIGGCACAAAAKLPIALSAGQVHSPIRAITPGTTRLYSQNNADAGLGIPSQNFTGGSSSAYTSAAADDFVVPAGHKWRIKEVDVTGVYFNGSGPASSESVIFYKDNKGLPGDILAECNNLNGADNHGSFAITIPKACKVNVNGGRTYWVSVVANQDFVCCGQWYWETRSRQRENPAAWENPKDGFGTGCTTWETMTSCIGENGEGPDFMFALRGKDVVL